MLGLKIALRRFKAICDSTVASSVHVEYIDDLISQFQPQHIHLVVPVLEVALASVNLRLNHGKSKVGIPSAFEGQMHPLLVEFGLPQVFQNIELLGGCDGRRVRY